MGIWKWVVVALLVLVVACSGEAQESSEEFGPLLTREMAGKLARTELIFQIAAANEGGIILAGCGTTEIEGAVMTLTRKWIVFIGECLFIVDDATGEVTGP